MHDETGEGFRHGAAEFSAVEGKEGEEIIFESGFQVFGSFVGIKNGDHFHFVDEADDRGDGFVVEFGFEVIKIGEKKIDHVWREVVF